MEPIRWNYFDANCVVGRHCKMKGGDLHTAETVLKAGERNAVDMLPVYDGVTEVLDRREALRVRHMAAPIPSPPPTEDEP